MANPVDASQMESSWKMKKKQKLQYIRKSVHDLSYGLLYNMKSGRYFGRRRSQVQQKYLSPHPQLYTTYTKFLAWERIQNSLQINKLLYTQY